MPLSLSISGMPLSSLPGWKMTFFGTKKESGWVGHTSLDHHSNHIVA